MRVISFITHEDVIYRILAHLDLLEPDPPPEPPPREDLCEAALADVASQRCFVANGLRAPCQIPTSALNR